MVEWKIVFTKQAQKDAGNITESGLKEKVIQLLEVLKRNPYSVNPPFKKLKGDLEGAYSRRINVQHRLIEQIYESEKIIKIIRMWTHYE